MIVHIFIRCQHHVHTIQGCLIRWLLPSSSLGWAGGAPTDVRDQLVHASCAHNTGVPNTVASSCSLGWAGGAPTDVRDQLVYVSLHYPSLLGHCPLHLRSAVPRGLVCLSVCFSACLSVYLSVCLPVCLSICLSVCLSDCLSVCLSVGTPFLLLPSLS